MGERDDFEILLVEGDRVERRHLAAILSKTVHTVHTAKDGREGALLFAEHHPMLLVADLTMSAHDTLGLIHEARAADPELPVILTLEPGDHALLANAFRDFPDLRVHFKPVDAHAIQATALACLRATRATAELRDAKASFRHLLAAAPGFLLMAQDARVIYANPRLLRFLGHDSLTELNRAGGMGRFVTTLDGRAYDGHPHSWVERLINDQLDRDFVVTLAGARGGAGRPDAFVASVSELPEAGRHLITLSGVSDIEEDKSTLREQATRDPLTGAINRRRLMELLADCQRQAAAGTAFSLIMFDIDHFKKVNDTYGHDAGDVVLREIADLVRGRMREADALARWGGEEFLVLAPGMDLDAAREAGERLRQAVEQHAFPGVPKVTGSFGVARHQPGETAEHLLKRVDEALYRAKEGGRNRVIMG